jgi:replicative DNA helicase
MHIISGLTGQGKTAFAVSLTKNFIEMNLPCLWFSFEISSQELFERFGKEVPVFYLPRLLSSKSALWIEKKIHEAVTKYGTKIIFIDHLHYLADDASVRNKNLPEILGALCRSFKMMARKERVVIFLLCHMRKVGAGKERPSIEDLKDSSGIAQESDSVMIVHRRGKKRARRGEIPDEFAELSTDVNIWIDKNRRTGKLGCVPMIFNTEELVHLETQ